MHKDDLINEIDNILEQTKDFGKFENLWLDDGDPKKIMFDLNLSIHRVRRLLQFNELKEVCHPKNKALQSPIFGKEGSLVQVRPCGKEYGDKTYLGFLIGEIALGSSLTIKEDKIQCNFAQHNPAIFVPELGKIIYGIESWWSVIKSTEQLKEITNDDIENTWYVKMWQAMMEKESKPQDQ